VTKDSPSLRFLIRVCYSTVALPGLHQEWQIPKAAARTILMLKLKGRLPSPGQVMAGLSIFALMALSLVLGAAIMHFRLPPHGFLSKAFNGATAWYARGKEMDESADDDDNRIGVTVDEPAWTWDGFTLYTSTKGSWAGLIDMRGKLVHEWQLPFRKVWPKPAHIRDPLPDNKIHWFTCHLYPNGDLLAIYQVDNDTPHGYGLVKLNKASEVLWSLADNVHHAIDVAEDGTIYALTHQIVKNHPARLDFIPVPYLGDSLVVLSPQGKQLNRFPIPEAFRDSKFGLALDRITDPPSKWTDLAKKHRTFVVEKGDITHCNSVKVLSEAQAAKFPLFKAAQVLICLRNLDSIAVLDSHTRSVVWAAQGSWCAQHDASFLENGHILLYDNLGSAAGTRVIEYDPKTQAIPWTYQSKQSGRFFAATRGSCQRLGNGNTLIVEPGRGRIFEVTPEKKVVWECFCPEPGSSHRAGISRRATLPSARRFASGQLKFLPAGLGPRP
jgi:hypothetical protein